MTDETKEAPEKETKDDAKTPPKVEVSEKKGFEPVIVGFLCNWCSYAGADLCGVSRYQYPTNIRVVRVMCSTRVDPFIILEMFIQGADGILVGGCHLGDCHYISGNYHTMNKMKLTKKLLEISGLDPERLRLEWISASEGEKFSQVITEFTETVRQLGPSPIRSTNPDIDLLEATFAAQNASTDFRLRALVGRERMLTEQGNVYNEKISEEKIAELYDKIIMDEFIRHRILQITKNRPLSVKDIAKIIGQSPKTVLTQIVTLKDRGLITLHRIDSKSPLFVNTKAETEVV
ncbi:MAG: hydrogenase iron-sulfur subunit [Thermoplasmata archaeon]|nr:MAG: hydrogenase iron-sulfur subunit [Thermoplasmata archaeon]